MFVRNILYWSIQVILGTVQGWFVCTGYTGECVFVQVILWTVHVFLQVILEMVQCVCTGHTGDSVFVQITGHGVLVQVILWTVHVFLQVILETVWCVCLGYMGDSVLVQITGHSVFAQVILGTVCLHRLYWGLCVFTRYIEDGMVCLYWG